MPMVKKILYIMNKNPNNHKNSGDILTLIKITTNGKESTDSAE